MALAPHNLTFGLPGQPQPPQENPDASWPLGCPPSGRNLHPAGVHNIRAPVKLEKQLNLEDRMVGGEGGSCNPSPAEVEASLAAWGIPPPTPNKGLASEERACLFSSGAGGWTGSRISKRFHPLLLLPGPTPMPQAAFQNQRGSCPRRNPLNRKLGLQPSSTGRNRPFPA